MLYLVWDVLFGVIGVVDVCGGGRWWVPMEGSGKSVVERSCQNVILLSFLARELSTNMAESQKP